MWSIFSLPLLPGSLWPGVVAPDKALSLHTYAKLYYFNITALIFKLRTYVKLNYLI